MSRIILYTIGAVILVIVLYLLSIVWSQVGEVELSIHGNIAIILVIIFGALVSGGLTALMFYSSRKGYDDEAHSVQEDRLEAIKKDFDDKRE